jgi:hypothetical protein
VNVAPAPAGSIPVNGLVLRYDFSSNATPVADLSGNNHTGVVYGAVWTNAGAKGGGYWFDGVNDYIRVPKTAMLNITGQLTVAFWMRRDDSAASMTPISKHDTTDKTPNAYWSTTVQADGVLRWYVSSAVQTTAALSLDGWEHIVIVQKNTTSWVYENGALAGSSTLKAIPGNLKDILIGRRCDGQYFKGTIDEVLVYRRCLSESEVLALYYATGTFTNSGSGVVSVSNTLTVANAIAQQNPLGTNILMGAVGIGTNAPATKLDVNGDTTVRGALTVVGSIAGNGSALTNMNAANLASGAVPLGRISGLTSNQMDSATDAAYRNNALVTDHAALVNLSYANSGHTGFQPAGNYLTNAQTGVTLSGTFSGTGAGLTGLSANNLSAGTVPLIRLSGITTNQMAPIVNLYVGGQGRFAGGITYIPQMGDISMGSFTNAP